MYTVLKTSHSYFAWVALAMIIISILAALMSGGSFKTTYKKIALFGLISAHIQLLFGLMLYFVSPFGFNNLSGDTMKDSYTRLLAVEHPITNIVAIILITIGYSQAKKLEDGSRKILIFYTVGLLLLLSRVPWSTWLG